MPILLWNRCLSTWRWREQWADSDTVLQSDRSCPCCHSPSALPLVPSSWVHWPPCRLPPGSAAGTSRLTRVIASAALSRRLHWTYSCQTSALTAVRPVHHRRRHWHVGTGRRGSHQTAPCSSRCRLRVRSQNQPGAHRWRTAIDWSWRKVVASTTGRCDLGVLEVQAAAPMRTFC